MVPEIIHIPPPPPPPQKLTGNSQQGVGGAVWNVKQGIKIFQGGGDRFKRKKKIILLPYHNDDYVYWIPRLQVHAKKVQSWAWIMI